MLDDIIQDQRTKRRFATDITRLIKDITDKNEHTILGLDANEVLEPLRVPMKTTNIPVLQRKYGLQDIYKYQHKTLGDTTTTNNT